MDPLGFGLENFDALGQWRTEDAGVPIDASGVLPDGTKVDGAAALRAAPCQTKVNILLRSTLEVLTSFGDGGRQPGQFYGVHNLGTDSKGNLHTAETYTGARVQRFIFKGVGPVQKQHQGVVWPASARGAPSESKSNLLNYLGGINSQQFATNRPHLPTYT